MPEREVTSALRCSTASSVGSRCQGREGQVDWAVAPTGPALPQPLRVPDPVLSLGLIFLVSKGVVRDPMMLRFLLEQIGCHCLGADLSSNSVTFQKFPSEGFPSLY